MASNLQKIKVLIGSTLSNEEISEKSGVPLLTIKQYRKKETNLDRIQTKNIDRLLSLAEEVYKTQDLVGFRFGRLNVLQKTDKRQRKEFLYRCVCDCGNIVYQTSYNLKSGHARSCGCLQPESAKKVAAGHFRNGTKVTNFIKKPISNNTTGYLGVTTYQQGGRTKYQAQLQYQRKHYQKKGFDTAEEAYAARLKLEREHLPEELWQEKKRRKPKYKQAKPEATIIGERFGLLTVAKKTDEIINGKDVYECVCSCGRTVNKTIHDLRRGAYSCGVCIRANVSEKIPKGNKSGYLGVYEVNYRGELRYCAQLVFNRKKYYGGTFPTAEEAYQARLRLEKKIIPPELRKKHSQS